MQEKFAMPQPASKLTPSKTKSRKKLIIAIVLLICLLLSFWIIKQTKLNFGFARLFAQSGQNIFNRELTPEVPICENLNVENWYAYHRCATVTCTIYAQSNSEQHLELRKRLRENRNAVDDAIRTVIGNAELQDIRDPQLNFVKRQLHSRMEDIVGEGLVEEILIPQWLAGRGIDSHNPRYATTRSIWQSEY